MATYSQYSQAWLEDNESIRIVLVVAGYYDVVAAAEKSVYLSNASYTTTDNVTFSPLLRRDITLSENLNADGSGAMTFGDLEIDNSNGDLDNWLDPNKYIWSNRSLKVYYIDPQWVLANVSELDTSKCLTIFNGVTDVVLSRARNTINLIIRDKLERLNAPVSDDKLGVYGTWTGGQQSQDSVKPIVFGETFNTSPLLIDPAKLKYLFNNGTTESLLEIRDNGMPLPTATEVTGLTLTVSVTNGVITGTPTVVSGGSGFVINDVVYIENASVFNSSLTSRAKFTANVSGTTLTVTEVLSGSLSKDMVITGTGIPAGTTITTAVVDGGVQAYTLSASATTPGTGLSMEGLNAVATYRIDGVSSGAVTAGTVLTGGSGYTAGTKTTGIFGIATTRKINVVDSRVGIFMLANQPSGTVTCSVQGMKYSMNLPTGALLTGTYTNNIAKIIALVVSQYGVPANRFNAATEIDTDNFNTFSTAYPQPVGAYITDNINILSVCRALASSVSAGIFMTRQGKLKLLTYGSGFTVTAVPSITEADIIYNSLSISQKPTLVGCVKLAYAKNYTVQTGLLTSIASAHKDTLAEEWLTNTVINSAKIARYKLSQDVAPQTTNLIVSSDASTEAQIRLDYYSTQKTIYKFTGTARLLGLELGQTVTLIHSRFDLYNSGSGRTGQVVSLAPNWSTGRVEVEVII